MKLLSFISFLPFVLGSPLAAAQEQPPANFENWGVCPFECCQYRDWVADDDIPVHQSRSDQSAVIFHLHRQEKFCALTGVVVTEKPGVVLIDKPVQDGYVKGNNKPQLTLNAGDKIYMLSPLGEGAYLFWYRGKVYSSGTGLAAMPGADGKDARMTWWKQVKNKAGKRGWTTSDKFSNADSCG
ncbi:hypothetical protein GM658_06220 [Pseudoduganella eburnea]|uniref:Uncharacterized protein n=1 Tax=Massilia eburnea TaxID=1776165 RepID=A0A6L6QDR8_9BURK|nr:hypothetical protein [Massilia eburnea]MTW10194.1 hypothetical protein [Massilia eburnea]